MAQAKIDVPAVVIGSIDVSTHIKNFIAATTALKTAKTAEEIAKLKSLRNASILGVADALTSVLPIDERASQVASLALNTIYFVRNVITLPAVLTLGQVVNVMFGLAGLVFGLFSLFGLFGRKKKQYFTVGWSGEVLIKVSKTGGKIVLSADVRPGACVLAEDVTKQLKQIADAACKQATEALSFIPSEDIDFVWKYLARPKDDTFVIKIRAIRSGKVGDQGDVDNLVRGFVKDINQQLGNIVRTVRDVAENACMLTFLKEVGAADKVEMTALNMLPELGYEVEGKWRKELERLTIKLTRTREYDRQISAGLRGAIVQFIADAIYHTPCGKYIGKTLCCDKTRIRNKLYSLGKSHPEVRYGMDLIGENFPFRYQFKRKGWWVEEHRWAEGNIPPGWLFQEASYILKPEVKNGKLVISYRRKNLKFHKKTFFATSYKESPYEPNVPLWGISWEPSLGSTQEMQIIIEGLATWPPTNDAYDYLLERILAFINYLLSDIPTEAAKYVVNKVSTAEVYLNQYLLLNDAKTTFSVDAWDCQLGLKHRGVQTWSNKPSIFLWLTCTTNSQAKSAWLRYKDLKEKQRKLRDLEQSARPGIYGERSAIDFFILKDVSSFYVPNPDEEKYTNLPRALNAMVQDIVDVYFIWLKGYGEEWKKRIRQQVLEESLPTIRMSLRPMLAKMASMYASLPEAGVSVGELEIYTTVINELNKRIQETTDYLPLIIKNRDAIIEQFGIDEYNRLLEEAKAYRKKLAEKRADYISKMQQVDLEFLNSLDLSKLTEAEKQALDATLDRLIANLKKAIDQLDHKILAYQAIINELKQM